MKRLWVAGAVGGLAQTVIGVAATLLANDLAGGVAAGLPQTVQVLGTAGAAPLIGRWSSRGRGVGLALGALVGAAGCFALIAAAAFGSVALVLAGSFASGFGAAAVSLSRYAAVDVSQRGSEARAVSAVLAAVAVGAVAGPNLLAPAAALDKAASLPTYTTAFALAALTFLTAAALWPAATPPSPAGLTTSALVAERADRGRSGAGIGPAVALLAVANLVMVGVMTMAPVQLHHVGGGLALVGAVVGVHIAAMFAPAPLSGWIVDRFGIGGGAAVASATLLSATSLAAFAARSTLGLAAAVALLGLGWSAATVTGSAALIRATAPADRPRAEAIGEVGMALAAAIGGAASGLLVGVGGYALLATTAAACVAGVLIPITLRLSATSGSRSRAPIG
ncbi:MFS transporter [Cryptosporangium sp. NPDC048952]|uniref:MFS transporter n=1 Tax=Cryptosporangium sp. NPDC048952 TaxID=3363961 RepID=UPI0037110922